jgi:hypothetical protein
MLLKRGDLTLEFFPHPELDPLTSWFSGRLRLDDLDGFYAICRKESPRAARDNRDYILPR